MGKWVFCGEYGDDKKVYRCSECGSTITVDGELIGKMNGEKFCYNCGGKMNGEKFCYNCGERMNGESIEKNRVRTVDLIKILDHYGREAQRRQAVEELSELIQAICKYDRINYTFGECEDDPKKLEKAENAYKNLLGEIADVIVMIEQLKIMVGERNRTRIENIIDEKIKRQLDRIERERTAKE